MMFRTILLIALLMFGHDSKSQNLVSNPGFDSYTSCPSQANQLHLAAPWYNPTILSPDFYNVCSSSIFADVPDNILGNQVPLSGNGYAGIFASQLNSAQNVREYIRIILSQPLQPGVDYRVKFSVNLCDVSMYAVATLGAYFSATDTAPMVSYLMSVIPQVENNSLLAMTDTVGWMAVEGVFTASGNEQYMTIGNFRDEAASGLQTVGGSTNHSYYFIDDVSVIPDSLTYLPELFGTTGWSVYPNPAENFVQISFKSIPMDDLLFQINDGIGRLMHEENVKSGTVAVDINISKFSAGVYFIKEGTINNGRIAKFFVCD